MTENVFLSQYMTELCARSKVITCTVYEKYNNCIIIPKGGLRIHKFTTSLCPTAIHKYLHKVPAVKQGVYGVKVKGVKFNTHWRCLCCQEAQ